MRLLSSVAIITLYEVLRSNAAPNGPDIGMSTDHAASSSGSDEGLEIRRQQALENVIGLAKNYSTRYYNAFRRNTSETFAFSLLADFFTVNSVLYGMPETEKQTWMKTLGSDNYDPEIILLGIQTLIDTLNSYTEVDLRVRNKIYVLSGISLNPKYVHLAKKYFRSSVGSFDFQNGYSMSLETDGRFTDQTVPPNTDLLSEIWYNHNSKAVFASAIYFKGLWKIDFESSVDLVYLFHVYGRRDSVFVNTINIIGWFRHGEVVLNNLRLRYVELPYKTNDRKRGNSMFVFLPMSDEDYEQLLNQWTKIDIKQLATRSVQFVRVYLPKFRTETTFSRPSSADSSATDTPGTSSTPAFGRYENKIAIEVDKRGSSNSEITGSFSETGKIGAPRDGRVHEFIVDRPFVAMIATTGPIMSIELVTVMVSGSEFELGNY